LSLRTVWDNTGLLNVPSSKEMLINEV